MLHVNTQVKKMKNVYRGIELPSTNRLMQRFQALSWTAAVVLVLSFLATSSSGSASIWSLFSVAEASAAGRNPSSTFPTVSSEDDTSDILRSYPAYLNFVLEVGRRTDARSAQRLEKTYQTLRARYPRAAALFLKGLRFEMVSKIELMGASPSSVNSNSAEMRRWVAKFMPEWSREADEHLFRAVTASKSRGDYR
jgi:hypothetical protein